LLRDEGAANDAMHDVFIELLRRKNNLENRGLTGLLMTVATNVCLNRIRSRNHRPEVPQTESVFEIASLDPVEERTLTRRWLIHLFDRHPETTRMIAFLYYLDRLTLEEVANEVGMSVSGVRKRLDSVKNDGQRLRSLQLNQVPS
jgi:RNA polymerase sigma-70 factor (ECF subfamily)